MQTVKSPSDVLTFGKHKGETVRHVVQTDPAYILWLYEEEIVDFPEDVILEAERIEDERS